MEDEKSDVPTELILWVPMRCSHSFPPEDAVKLNWDEMKQDEVVKERGGWALTLKAGGVYD